MTDEIKILHCVAFLYIYICQTLRGRNTKGWEKIANVFYLKGQVDLLHIGDFKIMKQPIVVLVSCCMGLRSGL